MPRSIKALEIGIGDMLGFSGRGWQSLLIKLGTRGFPLTRPRWAWRRFGGLSHVAVVSYWPEESHNGEPRPPALWESTTNCEFECLVAGRTLDGVQCHPILRRLEGYDGLVWRFPLTVAARQRFNQVLAYAFLRRQANKPYDYRQALDARDGPGGWFWRRVYAGDAAAAWYCSELAAGFYGAGFEYAKSLWNPADLQFNPRKLVRTLVRGGILAKGELIHEAA